MSTHSYEYTYVHPTSMRTSERLNWFDLEIYEVGHKERIAVDENITSY
jgi:hypothetical protein